MINTNRPGVSQGAFSVGTNVLQFESGLSFGKEKHELQETEANAFNWDYSVRYGVWKEELEISLIGSFQRNKVTGPGYETTLSNFRSNTLGAKYLIYDPYKKMVLDGPNLYSWKANNRFQWKDLIPAVSIYAGANFDFADNPFTPEQTGEISLTDLDVIESGEMDPVDMNLDAVFDGTDEVVVPVVDLGKALQGSGGGEGE